MYICIYICMYYIYTHVYIHIYIYILCRCVYMYICIVYTYIYIYIRIHIWGFYFVRVMKFHSRSLGLLSRCECIMLIAGRNRFGSVPDFFENSSVRFGSVRFGSVRTIQFPGSTRFGLCFSDSSWLGPVRFGSVPRPVPAGSEIKRFGSVWFGRFGSFLFICVLKQQDIC